MSDVRNVRVQELAQKMEDQLAAYGPDQSRLLVQVLQQLAHGRPITAAQVDQLIAERGIPHDEAYQFLRQVVERDTSDQIVGAMGLSLSEHTWVSPHRLTVAGVPLSAWCALDTLFLPVLLQQTATIESPSPVTGQTIRLQVTPERVEDVNPAGAVISLVLLDLGRADLATVEAIWSAFCNQVHFFATREEGERWASERDDIAILSVDEGFALGRQVWSRLLIDAT